MKKIDIRQISDLLICKYRTEPKLRALINKLNLNYQKLNQDRIIRTISSRTAICKELPNSTYKSEGCNYKFNIDELNTDEIISCPECKSEICREDIIENAKEETVIEIDGNLIKQKLIEALHKHSTIISKVFLKNENICELKFKGLKKKTIIYLGILTLHDFTYLKRKYDLIVPLRINNQVLKISHNIHQTILDDSLIYNILKEEKNSEKIKRSILSLEKDLIKALKTEINKIKILAKTNKEKGNSFENLIKDILDKEGYSNFRTNIYKTGIELDVTAIHKLNKKRLLTECKAWRIRINTPKLEKFFGTLTKEINNKKYDLGYYFSLSGYISTAEEWYDELDYKDRKRFYIFNHNDILEKLIKHKMIVDKKIKEPKNLFLMEKYLIYTNRQFYMVFLFSSEDKIKYFLILNRKGQFIKDKTANQIKKLDDSLKKLKLVGVR